MNYIKFLSIFMLLTSLAQATVYENGDNNNPNGSWRIYDLQSSEGASVNSVYDNELNSDVIEFTGKYEKSSFILGGMSEKYSWKNHKERLLSWKMKLKENSKIFVYLQTKKGRRVFIYSSSHKNTLEYISSTQRYIHFNLDEDISSKKWIKIERNLDQDLKKFEKENQIISVDGFRVEGLGRIDDIELNSINNPTTNPFLNDVLTGELHPLPNITVIYNEQNTRAYILVSSQSSYGEEHQGLTLVNLSTASPTIINHIPLECNNYYSLNLTNSFFTENGSILVLTLSHFQFQPSVKIYSIDISDDLLTILDSKIHTDGWGVSSFHKVNSFDIFYSKDHSPEQSGSTFFYVANTTGIISSLSLGIPGFSDYNYLIDHGAIGTDKYYKTYRQFTNLPYAWVSRKEIYDISNLPETTLLETVIFDESDDE